MVEAQRRSTIVKGRTGNSIINYMEGQPTYSHKKFEDVTPSSSAEAENISANSKFIAIAWTDKSTVFTADATNFHRVPIGCPMIRAHKGAVTDLAFSPHREELLATACDDSKLRFFLVQEGGVKENIREPDDEIAAHDRKINGIRWHNSVENLIASHSMDGTVKLWDVNGDGDPLLCLSDLGGNVQNVQWSYCGKNLAMSLKDAPTIVIGDVRDQSSLMHIDHGLTQRYAKPQYVDDDTILITGFNGQSNRAWSLVDLRNTSAPIGTGVLPSQGMSNYWCYYDRGLSYFTLAGRGDQSVEFYQVDVSAESEQV